MLETERLALTVLRRDKQALRQLAHVEGEPMSVVVRHILRAELKKRGLLKVDQGHEVKGKACREAAT
jgi:hypothetical protein